MDLVAQLGRNVRARRIEAGLSQEALAFAAGMKRSYLSDLERGTRNPTVRAMGVSPKHLALRPRSCWRSARISKPSGKLILSAESQLGPTDVDRCDRGCVARLGARAWVPAPGCA